MPFSNGSRHCGATTDPHPTAAAPDHGKVLSVPIHGSRQQSSDNSGFTAEIIIGILTNRLAPEYPSHRGHPRAFRGGCRFVSTVDTAVGGGFPPVWNPAIQVEGTSTRTFYRDLRPGVTVTLSGLQVIG